MKSSWRPYIILAFGLLAVSSSSILIRFAQNEHAPSMLISAWRVSVASLVLVPFILTRYRQEIAQLKRSDLMLSLASGLMLAIHFSGWITSLEYTSVINSVVLVTTNPLWVALASPFVLREKLTRGTIVALLLALTGAVLISLSGDAGTAPKQGQAMLGNLLAVIGAIAVAGYYLIGRRVRARVSVIPYIWMTYSTAAILLSIIILLTGQQVTGLSSNAYFWMTLIGLVPQLIGHSAYNYALGYLSASYVSLTILGEPIVSTILAIFLLKERIDLDNPAHRTQLFGGLLILIALVIASREETSRAKLVRDSEIQNVSA